MSDARHVVLAKPGDLLLIGGVGPLPVEQLRRLREVFVHLGIETLFFAADIDIDQRPGPCSTS